MSRADILKTLACDSEGKGILVSKSLSLPRLITSALRDCSCAWSSLVAGGMKFGGGASKGAIVTIVSSSGSLSIMIVSCKRVGFVCGFVVRAGSLVRGARAGVEVLVWFRSLKSTL